MSEIREKSAERHIAFRKRKLFHKRRNQTVRLKFSVIDKIEKSEREEYQFNYVEYDKDEYIGNLEKQVTETQMALCDIYEMVVN